MRASRWLRGAGALAIAAMAAACAPAPAASSAGAPVASAPPPPAGSPVASTTTADVTPAVVQFSLLARAAPEWNTWVALNQGFFSAEGIDAQLQVMGVGVASPAIVSGSLDIAELPFDALVITRGAGDVVGIASGTETPIYTLVGGPGVNGAADLRGKLVATSAPTGITAALLKKMTGALGLGPGDFQTLTTGGSRERYVALQSGQVGGALLSQPFDVEAVREGLRPLVRSSDVVTDTQFTNFSTTRPWLRQHRDVAVRFIRAIIRANRWLYDPANRHEAEAILVKETGASPEIAADIYDLAVREVKMIAADAEPVRSHLQGSIDLLLDVQSIEPPAPSVDQLVDLSALREAQASLR